MSETEWVKLWVACYPAAETSIWVAWLIDMAQVSDRSQTFLQT